MEENQKSQKKIITTETHHTDSRLQGVEKMTGREEGRAAGRKNWSREEKREGGRKGGKEVDTPVQAYVSISVPGTLVSFLLSFPSPIFIRDGVIQFHPFFLGK